MPDHLKFLICCLLIIIFSHSVSPAQIVITGKVIDEKGEPLQGAYVLIQGYELFIMSNEEGMFKLKLSEELPPKEFMVVLRGYQRQNFPVKKYEKILEIRMIPRTKWQKFLSRLRRPFRLG
ncbi:MAG: carboxypeptidase-like regulatory domain-containing protein [Bacteroidota bacterium]